MIVLTLCHFCSPCNVLIQGFPFNIHILYQCSKCKNNESTIRNVTKHITKALHALSNFTHTKISKMISLKSIILKRFIAKYLFVS